MHTNTLYQLSHLRFGNLYPLYYFASRVGNKVLSIPSDLACQLNSTDWFEQSVLFPRYQQWRERHKEHLPKLEASELAIVEQLEHKGICISSFPKIRSTATDLPFRVDKLSNLTNNCHPIFRDISLGETNIPSSVDTFPKIK